MAGKHPDYDVLTPQGHGDATRWTKIGAGWTMEGPEEGGRFISIALDALPLNGRLIVVAAEQIDHVDAKRRRARKKREDRKAASRPDDDAPALAGTLPPATVG